MTDVTTNTAALPRYLVDINGNPSGVSTASTVTSVPANVASVLLLSANTLRRGATITNTDANPLYVRLSNGAATVASPTVIIAPNGYYEVPFNFTGGIAGIWATAGAGAAVITQFT
jgi:hypothetical protein